MGGATDINWPLPQVAVAVVETALWDGPDSDWLCAVEKDVVASFRWLKGSDTSLEREEGWKERRERYLTLLHKERLGHR